MYPRQETITANLRPIISQPPLHRELMTLKSKDWDLKLQIRMLKLRSRIPSCSSYNKNCRI